jgi:hypothetical protein
MTVEEVKQTFDELREKGHDDKAILSALGQSFEAGEITKDELIAFSEALGAEVDPEFAKMSDEEAKKNLWKTDPEEAKEGMSEVEVEDAEVDPDGDDAPSDKSKTEDDDDGKDDKDDKDDDEKKKAFGLMGLN